MAFAETVCGLWRCAEALFDESLRLSASRRRKKEVLRSQEHLPTGLRGASEDERHHHLTDVLRGQEPQ